MAGLRTGDIRTAAADPFDELAVRLLMRAHNAAGAPARALAAYHRQRVILATELGTDPAPATRALHQTILRDTTAQAGPAGAAMKLQLGSAPCAHP